MLRLILITSLFALALALLAPRAAGACSCTNNLTLLEEFNNAWVVFSGRVTLVQADPFGTLAVSFDPINRWKGPLGNMPLVVTATSPAVCGFPFTVGQEYLVFARMQYYGLTLTPTPGVDLCSRTSLLAGNPYLPEMPLPIAPTPVAQPSWGTLKVRYR